MGFPKILGSLRKAKTIEPISKTITPAKTIESLPAVVKPITVAEPVVSTVKPAVQGYQIQRFPGYQLKSLISGNPLEKQLSKTGTISTANIDALSKKMSAVEQSVIGKVLAEKFPGQKAVDYNDFRKGVQDELITYDRTPNLKFKDYGIARLGFEFADRGGLSIAGWDGLTPNTFTFSSPRIPKGDNTHFNKNTLGHSRTYTTKDEPDVLHVIESQSDWAQHLRKYNKQQFEPGFWDEVIERIQRNLDFGKARPDLNIDIPFYETQLKQATEARDLQLQVEHLTKNYTLRQIQENLRFAAERGQKKMRYPTRETASKIEGYVAAKEPALRELSDAALMSLNGEGPTPYTQKLFDLKTRLQTMQENNLATPDDVQKLNSDIEKLEKLENLWKSGETTYDPKFETILNKYSDFPKQFGKLFKDAPVRTTQDLNGNTWYEVDVPKDYLQTEWPFKNGGTIPSIFKNGGILKGQKGLSKVSKLIPRISKEVPVRGFASKLKFEKIPNGSMMHFNGNGFDMSPEWDGISYLTEAHVGPSGILKNSTDYQILDGVRTWKSPSTFTYTPIVKDADYYKWMISRQSDQVLNGTSGMAGLSRAQFNKLQPQVQWDWVERFFNTHTRSDGEPWLLKQGGNIKSLFKYE